VNTLEEKTSDIHHLKNSLRWRACLRGPVSPAPSQKTCRCASSSCWCRSRSRSRSSTASSWAGTVALFEYQVQYDSW